MYRSDAPSVKSATSNTTRITRSSPQKSHPDSHPILKMTPDNNSVELITKSDKKKMSVRHKKSPSKDQTPESNIRSNNSSHSKVVDEPFIVNIYNIFVET